MKLPYRIRLSPANFAKHTGITNLSLNNNFHFPEGNVRLIKKTAYRKIFTSSTNITRMANYTTLTDEQLVRAYAEGNNEAFDTLLRRHQDRIFNYILRIIKNEDIANDIFQETFVKAIQTIRQGRYTENGKFPAWISRIAHNLIIDYYRQEKSENHQSADLTDNDILNRKELCEDTIEDILISNQIRNDVKLLIEELPELQKEVLKMRYYQNLSFKEIAETTGVSINTALGRMRYAILNLRRIAHDKDIILTI